MCINPKFINPIQEFPIACGKCFECLKTKSEEWAYRLALEATLWQESCIITLTYDDKEFVDRFTGECPHTFRRKYESSERYQKRLCSLRPEEVQPRELQLFIKRLRKRLEPQKIRYFACGEYGSQYGRPHYHVIIFGWRPDDLLQVATRDKKGNVHIINMSPEVFDLWPVGFNSVDDVSVNSAKYCAKYLQKDVGKRKAFLIMSKSVPLGYEALTEAMIKTDKIYVDGFYRSIPNAYLKYMSKRGRSEDVERIKAERSERCWSTWVNNNLLTPERKHIRGEFRRRFIDDFRRWNKNNNIFDIDAYDKWLLKRQQDLSEKVGIPIDDLLRFGKSRIVPKRKKTVSRETVKGNIEVSLETLVNAVEFVRIYTAKLPFDK